MTAQSDPYVRVYFRIIDDERFANVYNDDRALAAWLRLLINADAMWPAPAPVPRSCTRYAMRVLSEAGLIELIAPDHYRIHGLDAERRGRHDAAIAAGKARAAGAARDGGRFTSGSTSDPPAGGGGAHQRPTSGRSSDPPAAIQPLRTAPLRSSPNHAAPLRSDAPAGAKRGDASKEGTNDAEKEYVARLVATVNDASVSETRRQAAHSELNRLGVAS